MNFIQRISGGIAAAVSNIAATAAQPSVSTSLPSGRIPGRHLNAVRAKGERLTEDEKRELGISEQKVERVDWANLTNEERLEYNRQKTKQQREAAEIRKAERKQNAIAEIIHGLGFKPKNDWERYPRQALTPELISGIAEAEHLDVSKVVAELEKDDRDFEAGRAVLMRHTDSATRKRVKEQYVSDVANMTAETISKIEPPDYEGACDKAQYIRRFAKQYLRRVAERARLKIENYACGVLIPAFQRQADTLEKQERAAHKASGGRFGLGFAPSNLLVALRQGHLFALQKMLPPQHWGQSPRGMAQTFGIILPEKK